MIDKEGNVYATPNLLEALGNNISKIVDIKPIEDMPKEVIPISGNAAIVLIDVLPAVRKLFAKEMHSGATEEQAFIKIGYQIDG